MYSLIVVLAVIVAILLAIIVLVQESKGGGLASSVAGANSVLGVRKTTDFVEKATWTLAGLLVVLSVSTTFFVNKGVSSAETLLNETQAPAPAAPQIPGQPAADKAAAPADVQQAPAAPAEAPAAPAEPAK